MCFPDLTVVCADAKTGKVSSRDIVVALLPNTMLVSLMLANNETGVIQPVGEVVRALREWEGSRESRAYTGRVFVHTDAAQVRECMCPCPVSAVYERDCQVLT